MEKDSITAQAAGETREFFTNPKKESREQNNELEARMCSG
jgi:hypothetical protein